MASQSAPRLATLAAQRPMRRSQALVASVGGHAERFRRDGYLLLRGALPASQLEEARDQVGRALRRLDLGAPTRDGRWLWNGRQCAMDALGGGSPILDAIEERGVLDRLACCEPLLSAVRAATGWGRVVAWPEHRHRLGVQFPRPFGTGALGPVPPRQSCGEFPGSTFVSAWIPLFGVPLNGGGVSLAEGSHREERVRVWRRRGALLGIAEDRLEESIWQASGAIAVAGTASPPPSESWLQWGFAAGDLLLLDAAMLHATHDNASPYLRVSVDLRFQPAGESAHWEAMSPPREVDRFLSAVLAHLEHLAAPSGAFEAAFERLRSEGPRPDDGRPDGLRRRVEAALDEREAPGSSSRRTTADSGPSGRRSTRGPAASLHQRDARLPSAHAGEP